jgi:hypothetical protein
MRTEFTYLYKSPIIVASPKYEFTFPTISQNKRCIPDIEETLAYDEQMSE